MTYLTIIVPVFNEERHIVEIIRRLEKAPLNDCEIIFVNDGSTDSTASLIDKIVPSSGVVRHLAANGGKTAAVREGLEIASGNYVIVQDADLEYDPADISRLLAVAQANGGAVYGRRSSLWGRPSRWVLASGVLLIDLLMLLLFRRWVRDHATCYKLMPAEMLRSFDLQSTGFEGCVEITAKLMRAGVPIYQVPISYEPCSAKDGKKLTWWYGWTALTAAWRWRNWTPKIGVVTMASEATGADENITANEPAGVHPDR